MQTPQALFTNYIIASVGASLARVRTAEYVVADVDRQQAWHLLSFALKVEEAWPVTRALLLALAPKMELAGFREDWIPYLEKGIQCAQQVGDLQLVAECELQIGILYRLVSRFDEAHRWLKASVEHFNSCSDIDGEARLLNELAWLEHLEHHYQDATQHVEQALTLLADSATEKAISYRVKGMIAFYQGDLEAAIHYHQQALEIFIKQRDQRRSAWSLQNLAVAFQWQNNFTEAFTCYHKAIAILTAMGDVGNLCIVHMNLGSTYYHSGKLVEAVQNLDVAKQIAFKLNDQLQLPRIHTHLGLAYLALADYAKAESAFHTSISYYDALEDRSWQLNAMDGLAMTFLRSQQYDRAMAILHDALEILPQITNMPNYPYLQQSLSKHLKEAEKESATCK